MAKEHPLASIAYRLRAGAFAYSFAVLSLQLWERQAGIPAFLLLALLFLAYPQVVHEVVLRARDQARAELSAQYVDPVLLGACTAALGFPTWIAYSLCSATTLNSAVNRGLVGAACSLVLFGFGILAWIVPMGLQVWRETSPLVTSLCFLGCLTYGTAMGCVLHAQLAERRARQAEPAGPAAGF